jgi:cell wall-associated NlpC family hydrolase
MVAIFSAKRGVDPDRLAQEINEIAAALHRRRQVRNLENKLNKIAHNLGAVEVSPQHKKLQEDLMAVAAAAGIFLSVATTSHYQVNPQVFQPTAITATTGISSAIRAELNVNDAVQVVAPSAVRTGVQVKALMRAIIGQESAGKFDIVNPHSGALGYGQVMPENVPSWSMEALGYSLRTEEFLQSPKLQIKIIEFQLSKAIASQTRAGRSEKEIVRRAASIWYSGQSRLWNNTKPQYYNGHPYPSIAEYTSSVWGKYVTLHPEAAERKVAAKTNYFANTFNPAKPELSSFTKNVSTFFNGGNKRSSVIKAISKWKNGGLYKVGVPAMCADFVRFVYKEAGINLPVSDRPFDENLIGNDRNPALAQSLLGSDVGKLIVNKASLQPGDIVGFKNTYGNWKDGVITHVGIYVGNGMMVDRSTLAGTVHHRSVNTFRFAIAVRPNT